MTRHLYRVELETLKTILPGAEIAVGASHAKASSPLRRCSRLDKMHHNLRKAPFGQIEGADSTFLTTRDDTYFVITPLADIELIYQHWWVYSTSGYVESRPRNDVSNWTNVKLAAMKPSCSYLQSSMRSRFEYELQGKSTSSEIEECIRSVITANDQHWSRKAIEAAVWVEKWCTNKNERYYCSHRITSDEGLYTQEETWIRELAKTISELMKTLQTQVNEPTPMNAILGPAWDWCSSSNTRDDTEDRETEVTSCGAISTDGSRQDVISYSTSQWAMLSHISCCLI